MTQVEVPQFADEIKQAGLVDERNLMFMANSLRKNTGGAIINGWAEYVFALNGDTLSWIATKKGKKLLIKDNIRTLITNADGKVVMIGSNKRFDIMFNNKSTIQFDMTNGTIQVVDKFLDVLGLLRV